MPQAAFTHHSRVISHKLRGLGREWKRTYPGHPGPHTEQPSEPSQPPLPATALRSKHCRDSGWSDTGHSSPSHARVPTSNLEIPTLKPGTCGDPSIIGLVCIASILNESILVLIELHFGLHHSLERDQDTEDPGSKKNISHLGSPKTPAMSLVYWTLRSHSLPDTQATCPSGSLGHPSGNSPDKLATQTSGSGPSSRQYHESNMR